MRKTCTDDVRRITDDESRILSETEAWTGREGGTYVVASTGNGYTNEENGEGGSSALGRGCLTQSGCVGLGERAAGGGERASGL